VVQQLLSIIARNGILSVARVVKVLLLPVLDRRVERVSAHQRVLVQSNNTAAYTVMVHQATVMIVHQATTVVVRNTAAVAAAVRLRHRVAILTAAAAVPSPTSRARDDRIERGVLLWREG